MFLVGMGLDYKCNFALPTVLLGLLLALFLVGSSILLLMVVQQLVAILVFSQEKMSAHPTLSSSLSMIISRSIHVTDGKISFLFVAE